MPILRDKIIVVDIESTCWGDEAPPGQQSEIIEIGVCALVVETGKIIDKTSILVRPQRSQVSPFCTELTTLTQAQVDSGIGFDEACMQLISQFDTKTHIWGSWGNYDRRMFRQQCKDFKVPYPFSPKHINLKALFAKMPEFEWMGLARALKTIGLDFEGTHHRGADDAWNIARVVAYLLQTYGRDILKKYS